MNMLKTVIKPMHPEGRPFLAVFAAAAVGLSFLNAPLGLLGLGLATWCYYFFRDPERVPPVDEHVVVSPADGIVSLIEPAVAPRELGLTHATLTRVSVFMNVFDCHVNRAPAAGTVTAVVYRPGKFFNASLDKASDENERNAIALRLPDGRHIGVVQIAGLVARRIVCFTHEGLPLVLGERFGLIRFGSRVDVYLPEGVVPLVRVGQTMVAGETLVARLDNG